MARDSSLCVMCVSARMHGSGGANSSSAHALYARVSSADVKRAIAIPTLSNASSFSSAYASHERIPRRSLPSTMVDSAKRLTRTARAYSHHDSRPIERPRFRRCAAALCCVDKPSARNFHVATAFASGRSRQCPSTTATGWGGVLRHVLNARRSPGLAKDEAIARSACACSSNTYHELYARCSLGKTSTAAPCRIRARLRRA
mmetsp:Transcript_51218/g.134673  ORF Transcript_51218/g.134673 Transcript_51218/m.134673 type:complete len:202 (+) Transcript_51218:990-1595(+)